MDASPSLVLLGSPHLRRAAARIDLPDALALVEQALVEPDRSVASGREPVR